MSENPIDAGGVQALTFDCYGTIVDWDGGIAAAFARVPGFPGQDLAALVAEREELEKELLGGPYLAYTDILAESLRRLARRHDLDVTEQDLAAFAASMATWPPFADSRDALLSLQSRFRLAILSNVERRVLDASVAPLEAAGVRFATKVTADLVRSYKPARAHFDRGLEELGLAREQVLHVAGSFFHDIRPATELGWRTVLVDRRGEGFAPAPGHHAVRSLAELAARLGAWAGDLE